MRIGDSDHGSTADDTFVTILDILKIFIHPDYNGITAYYDVAIIVTDIVTFSRRISPICLPEFPSENPDKYENDQVELIGWGQENLHGNSSPQLKRISLKINPIRYKTALRDQIFYRLMFQFGKNIT